MREDVISVMPEAVPLGPQVGVNGKRPPISFGVLCAFVVRNFGIMLGDF